MSRLVLHRALGSPPARAVLILADIIKLDLQPRDVKLLELEHKSPDFLKLNPMGTVPTLEDGEFILSESHAILKYLLDAYGDAETQERLYPTDVKTRALVDQCMFFNSGVFFNALKGVGLETFLSNSEGPSAKQKADIENSYRIVDAYLQSRRYIASDHLTLADLAAGTTATAVKYILPLDKDRFPKCADWVSRLEEEPSFKKHEDGVKTFGKLIHLFWGKNKQNNKQTS